MNRDLTRAIASEVRGVVNDLVSHDHSTETILEATRLLQQVREHLAGQPTARPYDITTAEGWEEVREWNGLAGLSNPLFPSSTFRFSNTAEGAPCGTTEVSFGLAYQGAPGCVHGGLIAACFDDVFSSTQRAYDFTAVTVELSTSYKAAARLERPLVFTTWYDEIDSGRKVKGRGTCTDGSTTVAEATALFVKLDLHDLSRSS